MAIAYTPLDGGSTELPVQIWKSEVDTESTEWAAHLASPIADLAKIDLGLGDTRIDDTWNVTTSIVNHGIGGRKIINFGSKVLLMTMVSIEAKTVTETLYKGPPPGGDVISHPIA